MLTRLKVHGFKNLRDIDVRFGPFTCIAGANGIGKSNVFDAIQFLSYLATESLVEASQQVRGASGIRGGDPRDLFWDGYRSKNRQIDMSVEMLVPAVFDDDLGASTAATTTFLTYDLKLGYEAPESKAGVGRLTLLAEKLQHITRGDAKSHLLFGHSKKFRDSVVRGERRAGAFLSTEVRENGVVINVHGDGGSRGRPQPRAASRAGRTVLSSITTNDSPTILAAKREMQSWRRLALEPTALRAPDSFADPRSLGADGRHVASTLFRIAHEDSGSAGPDGSTAVYGRVARRLAELTGVGVDSVNVEADPVREVFTLFLQERGGIRLPARALSEGTLRFLALCVLLEDPTSTGLICMEEPENGIHPANLPAIVGLVHDLAVDPTEDPGDGNPLRQVIVNTHSPGVVQLVGLPDLLVADVKRVRMDDGSVIRALSLLPSVDSWRTAGVADSFTRADILAYLTAPPGAQLQLPLDLSA